MFDRGIITYLPISEHLTEIIYDRFKHNILICNNCEIS